MSPPTEGVTRTGQQFDTQHSDEAVGTPPPLGTFPGYAILAELGRGGMGVVYKARQIGLNRTVALKMVLSGVLPRAEELARFGAEAEAIARFRHPNIVQVFEVGTHDRRPFFSLEYCEGGSLARMAAGTPQEPRRAAALVEAIARGVQAAHDAGVVHRDLKPANVLIAADGTPKVTDFGLAKLLGGDGGPGLTATDVVMGTPSYMAPEQARDGARSAGPPADVYALGAILYELLTGRPPFKADSTWETLRQVVEGAVVPPGKLRPNLPRDLETICLKGLEKQPGDRYASAGELADDLRRWLDGEPIKARPAGRAERLVKWALRRPTQAAAVVLGALALGLAVGGAVVVALWQRAEDARQLAEAATAEAERLAGENAVLAAEARGQAARANKVSDFTVNLFRASDPTELNLLKVSGAGKVAPEMTLREVLDFGAARIESQLAGEPAALATLQDTIGDVYRSLLLFDKARPLLEAAYAARVKLFGDDHPEVAMSLLHLGRLHQTMGDFPRAEQCTREALAVWRRHLPPDDARIGECLLQLGGVLLERGDPEAEGVLRELIALQERRGAEYEAAVGRIGLASVYIDQKRAVEGLAEWEAGIQAVKGDPGQADAIRQAKLFQNGVVARTAGAYSLAEPKLRESLAIAERKLGRGHVITVLTRHELAVTLGLRGQVDEAERHLREVVEAARKSIGLQHPRSLIAVGNLAWLLHRRGRTGEAVELYEEALKSQAARFGADHPTRLDPLVAAADFLADHGQPGRAAELAREALALMDRAATDKPSRGLGSRLNLLANALTAHDARLAVGLYRRSVEAHRRRDGDRSPAVPGVLGNLGDTLLDLGDYAAAEPVCREGAELARSVPGVEAWAKRSTEQNLGRLLRARGEFAEAARCFGAALEAARVEYKEEPSRLAKCLDDAAGALVEAGRAGEAVPLMEEALELIRSTDRVAFLAMARLAAGDRDGYRRSAQELARIVGDNPTRSDAVLTADVLFWDAGRWADRAAAVRLAEAGVRSKPRNAWYQTVLGQSLMRAGRLAESIGPLTAAARGTDASAVVARLALAAALARCGRHDEAAAALADADRVVVECPSPYGAGRMTWLGRVRFRLMRAEAERDIREAATPPEPAPWPMVAGN